MRRISLPSIAFAWSKRPADFSVRNRAPMQAGIGVLLILAACLFSGCTTLQIGVSSPPPLTGMSANSADAAETPVESCYVELHSNIWPTKKLSMPIQDGMTVQDVLEECNARSVGRSLEIDVLRGAHDGNSPVRMPCEYDTQKRHVKFEQDYAIYPGDRIVVRPKANTALNQILRAAAATK